MKGIGFWLPRLSCATALTFLLLDWNAYAAGPGEAGGQPYADEAYVDTKATEPDKDFVSIYSGYEWVEDSNFFYAGFDVALNGDLSRRGFLLSGFGGFGNYDYFDSTVPGGKIDADLTELTGLIGYQVYAGSVRFSAFAGVDWQNNDLNPPDAGNPVSGSDTDFVASGAVESGWNKPLYYKLFGSYSITNETYWAKARIGHNFGRVVIGPEGAFYGNENFNSQRAGAFITFPLASRLALTLAGGFNFVANDEFFEELGSGFEKIPAGSFGGLGGITDGGYGNVSISTWF